MEAENSSLRSKWKKAQLESEIMMAETKLEWGIDNGLPRYIVDIPLSRFGQKEVREEAYQRFKTLAEANGYRLSESYDDENWRLLAESPSLLADIDRSHSAEGHKLSHLQSNPELQIRYSPLFWGFSLTFFLVFAVGLTYVFLSTEGVTLPAWLIAAGLYFGALFSATRVFDRRPKMVINEDGISMVSWECGLIPWQDIESIGYKFRSKRERKQGLNVEMILQQPAHYASRLWQSPFRYPSETGGPDSPIIIDLLGYDASVKELWRCIVSIDSAKEQVERGKRWRDEHLDPLRL